MVCLSPSVWISSALRVCRRLRKAPAKGVHNVCRLWRGFLVWFSKVTDPNCIEFPIPTKDNDTIQLSSREVYRGKNVCFH